MNIKNYNLQHHKSRITFLQNWEMWSNHNFSGEDNDQIIKEMPPYTCKIDVG
jgi:hypothetical protein